MHTVLMSLLGPLRHFVATQQFGRFRMEADIQRAALAEPDSASMYARITSLPSLFALLASARFPQKKVLEDE
jgi:hypothetical protein